MEEHMDETVNEEVGSDEALEDLIGRIVAEGRSVRERVQAAVDDAVRRVEPTSQRLSEIVRDVMDGAAAGLERSLPDDEASVLREVVDGLTESLKRAAHAAQLAMEEAQARGRTFAEEDLRAFADDMDSLASLLQGSVRRVVERAETLVKTDLSDLQMHILRTIDGVRPSLGAAADAARAQPGALAGEAAQSAKRAAQQAAGGVLSAAGQFLQKTGDLLRDTQADDDTAG